MSPTNRFSGSDSKDDNDAPINQIRLKENNYNVLSKVFK